MKYYNPSKGKSQENDRRQSAINIAREFQHDHEPRRRLGFEYRFMLSIAFQRVAVGFQLVVNIQDFSVASPSSSYLLVDSKVGLCRFIDTFLDHTYLHI